MASPNDIINQAVEDASNTDTDSVFWSWFFPGAEQREQFGQQASLQQMQNDWQSNENAKWNDEREKMKRMVEAGINPLTAAQGISGASTPPTSPSSASSPNLAPVSQLPDAVRSVGDIVDKFSSANERDRLLESRKKNLISDTFLKYKQAGYTEEQAKGLAIANAYLPTEKFLGILTLASNIKKLSAEYKDLMQGIEESKARIKEIDSQISLNTSYGNLAAKHALEAEKRAILLEAQTKEQNWLNDKREQYGIDVRSPLENNIFMLGITGDANYEKSLGIIRDVKYNQETGGYHAQADYAYDIAYEQGRAAYDFDWSAPPKTMFEFLTKGVVNIKQNLRDAVSNFRNRPNKASSDNSSPGSSKQELRQSYLRYKSGYDTQMNMLNMMRAELADRLAAGENQSETVNLRMEINRLNAELQEMPHTYEDFIKYVNSH